MTRTFSTGLMPATPDDLRGLAYDAERWQRNDLASACELEARICAALLSHQGWEYVAPVPYAPPVKKGRQIVQKAREAVGPRIRRAYSEPGDGRGYGGMSGSDEARPPPVLRDIAQAWGLLHGRVLLHLSDISADGLPAAHVGGGDAMLAEGKAHGGATVMATLVAAILRCEAMAREVNP